ncbi:MAG: Lrp/AsnC ligand binding domain-containing protein [Nitrososphaerota archaeon]
MVQAFVFIRTGAGKAASVAEQAGKLSGCRLACMVTGRYDVVVLIEAEDLKKLTEAILSKIHTIDGVERTETAIVV